MSYWYLLILTIFVWSVVYFLDKKVYSSIKILNAKETFKYLAIVLGVTGLIMVIITMLVSFFILKDDNIAYICVAIIVGLVVLFCYIKEQKEEEARKVKLSAWAELHDWIYTPNGDCSEVYYLNLFKRFVQGSNRYVFDVLRGNWHQYPADAFNFHYEIKSNSSSGSSTTHYYFGVILIYLNKAFIDLTIKPRSILSRGGIQFESIKFNKEFVVNSVNKRFAYDFCHPKTMEYLLEQRNVDLELKGNVMAVFVDCDRLSTEEIEESLDRLLQIYELMPNYLLKS